MIKVLVISDDMTGNNDTGALLNQAGLDTVAALRDSLPGKYIESRDALCLNTDSRALPAQDAKELVKKAVEQYWKPGVLCCKRIDSTLRGNIGAEIEGMLEMLPEGCRAVVVPAFPRAGRICIGGYMMVDGELLTSSGAKRDLKTPVHSSRVQEILAKECRRSIQTIELPEIRSGEKELAYKILKSEADILIMDAICEADIDRVAKACVTADIPVVCVDPGCFTVRMAQRKFVEKTRSAKNLLVVGSISEVTRKQIAFLAEQTELFICRVPVRRLLREFESVRQEILEKVRENASQYESICLLTDENEPEEGIAKAQEISDRFTEIGAGVWRNLQAEIACVYLCGGDIAKDFLDKVRVCAIDMKEEIAPLAVYGTAIGGNQTTKEKGFQVLTKGGMIGSESTVYEMLVYAKRARREEGDKRA